MAQAIPDGVSELEREYQEKLFNHVNGDIDSEDEEEIGNGATANKRGNGYISTSPVQEPKQVDRYGFVGGEQFTNPDQEQSLPYEVLRRRELKWIDMFENWEKWMSKRFKKVKDRCRKGIPGSIRARAWQYLCGSKFLMEQKGNKGKFDRYLEEKGDERCIDDIEKDLHRQFPFHEMFMRRSGGGQEDLFLVLKAYSIHNPKDGYCQAQAPIAAVLLMHMPAEQAFWCLVAICDKYLPGYYSPGLEAVQIDGDVLFGLLKKVSNPTYKHLKKQRVEPILCMTEWFMCVFTRTLPWTSVLRVWDMFFCEGVKVMFRVALVLFKSVLGTSHQLAECPGLYETLDKIRHIPKQYMEEEYLVRECGKISISEKDMEKEHNYQLAKRRKEAAEKNGPVSGKKKTKRRTSSSERT